MANYQTKPRQQVLGFLAKNPENLFTADELASALESEYGSEAPGKSTVYRLVGKLEREEQIRSIKPEGSRRTCYQLNQCHHHLHLQCSDCGQLIHMRENASSILTQLVLERTGFSVDEHHTVLYGRCEKCKGSV